MSNRSDLPPSGYVTAAWVKAHYSISNSTLYAWVAANNNGFPKPVRIGPRATRFAVEDLRRFEATLAPTVTTKAGS